MERDIGDREQQLSAHQQHLLAATSHEIDHFCEQQRHIEFYRGTHNEEPSLRSSEQLTIESEVMSRPPHSNSKKDALRSHRPPKAPAQKPSGLCKQQTNMTAYFRKCQGQCSRNSSQTQTPTAISEPPKTLSTVEQSRLQSVKQKMAQFGNLHSYRSVLSATRSGSSLSYQKEADKLERILQNTAEAVKTNRTAVNADAAKAGLDSHRVASASKRNISQELKQFQSAHKQLSKPMGSLKSQLSARIQN